MTYDKSRLTIEPLSRERVISPAFLLVATATFFAFLSIGIVLPVLPRYTEGPLGAGSIGVGVAVGAASLTALLAQPPAGRLGDLRGRRPLMIGGGILMVLGAAGLLVAEHIVPVVGLRLLTGIGRLHRLHHALRARRRSRRRGAAVRDLRRRRRDDPEPRREDSRPCRACEDGPVRAGRPRGRAGDDRNLAGAARALRRHRRLLGRPGTRVSGGADARHGRAPAGDRGAVAGTVTAFVDVAIAVGAIRLGGVADAGGYPAVFLVSAGVATGGLVVLQRVAFRPI